ncbi:MAG: hypothetical protein QM219_01320, partial [Bacillota bacterium]|nr:hypothetical protein [Bacillota bacterium]
IILLGAGYNPFCGYSIIPPLYISLPGSLFPSGRQKNFCEIFNIYANRPIIEKGWWGSVRWGRTDRAAKKARSPPPYPFFLFGPKPVN